MISRYRRYLNTWQRYTWPERWLFLQLWFWLPTVAVALQLFGFKRLVVFLERHTFVTRGVPPNRKQVQNTVRLVEAATRHQVWHVTCLVRSLTLWWMLQRQGINSQLRIGVNKKEKTFMAHAWIEYKGVALNDSTDVDQRFAPFAATLVSSKLRV